MVRRFAPKCEDVTGWSAQVDTAFVEVNYSWQDGMRWALFPMTISVLKELLRFSRASGSTVVPCLHSPAHLARNHVLRSRHL